MLPPPLRAELLPLLRASGESAASDPVLPGGAIEEQATCAAAQSRVPCRCTCRIKSAMSVARTVRSDSYSDHPGEKGHGVSAQVGEERHGRWAAAAAAAAARCVRASDGASLSHLKACVRHEESRDAWQPQAHVRPLWSSKRAKQSNGRASRAGCTEEPTSPVAARAHQRDSIGESVKERPSPSKLQRHRCSVRQTHGRNKNLK